LSGRARKTWGSGRATWDAEPQAQNLVKFAAVTHWPWEST